MEESALHIKVSFESRELDEIPFSAFASNIKGKGHSSRQVYVERKLCLLIVKRFRQLFQDIRTLDVILQQALGEKRQLGYLLDLDVENQMNQQPNSNEQDNNR